MLEGQQLGPRGKGHPGGWAFNSVQEALWLGRTRTPPRLLALRLALPKSLKTWSAPGWGEKVALLEGAALMRCPLWSRPTAQLSSPCNQAAGSSPASGLWDLCGGGAPAFSVKAPASWVSPEKQRAQQSRLQKGHLNVPLRLTGCVRWSPSVPSLVLAGSCVHLGCYSPSYMGLILFHIH